MEIEATIFKTLLCMAIYGGLFLIVAPILRTFQFFNKKIWFFYLYEWVGFLTMFLLSCFLRIKVEIIP